MENTKQTVKGKTINQRRKRMTKEVSDNGLVRLPYTNSFVKKKDFAKAMELKAAYGKLIVSVSNR